MNDLNGVPTHYTLRYSGVEFQTEEKTVVVNYTTSTNETVSVSGLEAYTVYKISVTLSTSVGEGDAANIEIRTLETAPTGTPTDLTTNVLSANIISVTWDDPLPIEQNGVITAYTLTYKGVERDTTSRDVILYSNGTFFTNYILSELDEHTNYSISVSASTSVGEGPSSTLTVITDQDGEFVGLIVFLALYVNSFMRILILQMNLFIIARPLHSSKGVHSTGPKILLIVVLITAFQWVRY